MTVAVVLGTRPEIIKLAQITHGLGPEAHVVFTGQHHDQGMGTSFFDELGVSRPALTLGVGGSSRGHQVGEAVRLLDAHLAEIRPRAVVVQGDTNATLAGALAANARDVPLVHVEAGLRSFDRRMPEEHNRVVTDHLADLCCAPTEVSRGNLESESIDEWRVVVTGNPIVEAVGRWLPALEARRAILADCGVEPGRYVLATFHRPENVDDRTTLERVLAQLASLPFPVVYPMHPRAALRVEQLGLADLMGHANLRVRPPVGYVAMLALAAECALMVSDSGGLQEEATVVKRPIVVVRRSTERPEALGTFARLVGPTELAATAEAWLADVAASHAELAELPSPYGDGSASARCLEAIAGLSSR